jgi:hypothetical protein
MTAPRGLAVDGDEIGTLHDQQRHLGQRMRHPPRLAWVLDRAEMVGQDCQPGLRAEREVRIAQRSEDRGVAIAMARLRIGEAAANQISRNSEILVNPNAGPWARNP